MVHETTDKRLCRSYEGGAWKGMDDEIMITYEQSGERPRGDRRIAMAFLTRRLVRVSLGFETHSFPISSQVSSDGARWGPCLL